MMESSSLLSAAQPPGRKRTQDINHDLGQRIQALALATLPAEFKITQTMTAAISGISQPPVSRLMKQAKERGYDPSICSHIKLEYVTDAPRSGRPLIVTPELERTILDSLDEATRNDTEKPAGLLAFEHGISPTSMLRILKRNKFRSVKPTHKPGLTDEMKTARLKFCSEHEHWNLEDWKNVIWTDETSVVLGVRRCTRIRVWRRPGETHQPRFIRRRWKGYSEFMFWGSFSYDNKGPCHIWAPETSEERKVATRNLKKINRQLEPVLKAQWIEEEATRYANRARSGGRHAVWKWDAAHGKLERKGRGGIDWYRYQNVILKKKLLPFAQKCKETRPNTIVVEDGAPSHASKHQTKVFLDAQIVQSFWPGNSPDLNMIEPCWPWMKRETTKKGAPCDRTTAKRLWQRCWQKLSQRRIQA